MYFGGLYCSKVIIKSNSTGRRSDLSLNKSIEVLVKAKYYIERGGQKKWVCAGDYKSHHSMWDVNGRELAGSWREIKGIIDVGRLMVEPGTPTWKGGQSHQSSTIDLVIASTSAQVSMVEIGIDLYTGSDRETLC
jgi:hypothetical protein